MLGFCCRLMDMSTVAQPNTLADSRSRLIVRNANLMDVKAIALLTNRVYKGTDMRGYSESEIIGQINNFPQGQFVVTKLSGLMC